MKKFNKHLMEMRRKPALSQDDYDKWEKSNDKWNQEAEKILLELNDLKFFSITRAKLQRLVKIAKKAEKHLKK
jgi:hypothetical protein